MTTIPAWLLLFLLASLIAQGLLLTWTLHRLYAIEDAVFGRDLHDAPTDALGSPLLSRASERHLPADEQRGIYRSQP